MTPPPNLARVRRRLLAWFDKHQRDLPWRHDRDPYRIWVSEVMLQQTTVAAVIPYFQRFLTAFPTLAHLAVADEQLVLRHWEGLGYYRRARHLHQAARHLVATGGTLPDDPEIWKALPGVGRYILGAVLSQAFDRRMPIVEANSLRVICRLFGQARDPKATPIQKWLWVTAESLLPKSRAGDFNQAIMELGALVCTPRAPRCDQCPLRDDCVAYRTGRADRIPLQQAAATTEQVRETALVIRRGAKVLLIQRADDAPRWAGMWEFPNIELQLQENHATAARRLLKQLGLSANVGSELLTIRYTVTRFRMTMVAVECTRTTGRQIRNAKWLSVNEFAEYPLATAHRRIARFIGDRTKRIAVRMAR